MVSDPSDPDRVAEWRITETKDPVGTVVRYEYVADAGDEAGHHWAQPLVSRISYGDYGDRAAPSFLVTSTSTTSHPGPAAAGRRRPRIR